MNTEYSGFVSRTVFYFFLEYSRIILSVSLSYLFGWQQRFQAILTLDKGHQLLKTTARERKGQKGLAEASER